MVLAGLFAFGLPLLQVAGGDCTAIPSGNPCAADPERAWLGLAHAALLFFWFLLLLYPGKVQTDDVLKALALAGGVHAAYGLVFFSLGWTPLLLDGVFRHEQVPTGGFPNRNHYAAFLYVCAFAALALVLRLPGDIGTGRAARWRMLLDQRVLWRLLVLLMVMGVIATRSRAGNAALVVGLVVGFLWLALVERRRASTGGQSLRLGFIGVVVASVLLLDALLVGAFVGLEKVTQRIEETSFAGEARGDVNQVLLGHPELFTVFGHGPGSFLQVFEPHKPPTLVARFDHAHNDYLQVLVERGWFGALLFAVALVWMLHSALRASNGDRGAEVRFAVVAATSALLMHATVEYVTQVPAIWLAWLALIAIAVKQRQS